MGEGNIPLTGYIHIGPVSFYINKWNPLIAELEQCNDAEKTLDLICLRAPTSG